MSATIRDETWNVLNMEHITPYSKWWDYSDIPCGGHKKIKGSTHMALEKPPPSTHALADGFNGRCISFMAATPLMVVTYGFVTYGFHGCYMNLIAVTNSFQDSYIWIW